MKLLKGIFVSDIHYPWNIRLDGVLAYIKDLQPDLIILGGDIVDASGTYGVDSWSAKDVEEKGIPAYNRDSRILLDLMVKLDKLAPKAKYVFLEGNHEERYQRMFRRYPTLLEGKFKFQRDGVPTEIQHKFTWIPYGDYESYYKIGDTLFMHGTLYPDAHAKKMAYCYTPSKVVYGHLHDFQAYTVHNGDPRRPGRFAVTCGCLCERLPDYKKGMPNKWLNGFIDFTVVDGHVAINAHLIENGMFSIGGKVYGERV